MAALVESDRAKAGGERGAGEVVVVLLARAGAVQDDYAGGRWAFREPERVGQPVVDADLAREVHRDRARARHRAMISRMAFGMIDRRK
jgi:hypothetical protein